MGVAALSPPHMHCGLDLVFKKVSKMHQKHGSISTKSQTKHRVKKNNRQSQANKDESHMAVCMLPSALWWRARLPCHFRWDVCRALVLRAAFVQVASGPGAQF